MTEQERSHHTKLALMKAGLTLFAQKPFGEVKLKDIVDLAGQKNRNALQYHFGSKRALFERILLEQADNIDELRQQLINAISSAGEVTVEVAVDVYLQPFIQYTRWNASGKLYAKLLAHFLRTPERVEKILNPDIPMSTPPQSLAEVLVAITPNLSHSERDQLLYVSNSMMIYSLENLIAAEEQGILSLDSPIGHHILDSLHSALVQLWTVNQFSKQA
jgi:AcrR family transcriptional regulator